MLEQRIHEAIVKHLEFRAYPYVAWWHTPNGEARDARVGAKLKRMGVKSGVADIVGLVPNKEGSGSTFFALEIKGPKGKPTKQQQAFIELVGDCGGYAGFAYSVDDALDLLVDWGVIKPEAGKV